MENEKYFWSEREVLFAHMCVCLHLAHLSDWLKNMFFLGREPKSSEQILFKVILFPESL